MSDEKQKKELISQSNFAKLCGVSSEAVRKAIIAGKVDVYGEGRSKKIIVSGENSIAYLHDKNSQRKKHIPSTSVNPSEIKKAQSKSIHPDLSNKDLPVPSSSFKNLIELEDERFDINDISLTAINKMKGLEAARKSAQDRKIARGDLIDRHLVTTVMGKFYTIEVNELKPIADKTPSKIAAIFGDEDSEKILKINKLLSSEITKVLKHMNYEMKRFLNGINKNSTDLVHADN